MSQLFPVIVSQFVMHDMYEVDKRVLHSPKGCTFIDQNHPHLLRWMIHPYISRWKARQSVWKLCAPSSLRRWNRPAGEDPQMVAVFPPPHSSLPSSLPHSSPVSHPWQWSEAAQLMGELFPERATFGNYWPDAHCCFLAKAEMTWFDLT